MTNESTCLHCGRAIILAESGIWVDLAASGDDEIWREVCDSHDTFMAEHEPPLSDKIAAARGRDDDRPDYAIDHFGGPDNAPDAPPDGELPAGRARCPDCGIPTVPDKQDLTDSEKLCDSCFDKAYPE